MRTKMTSKRLLGALAVAMLVAAGCASNADEEAKTTAAEARAPESEPLPADEAAAPMSDAPPSPEMAPEESAVPTPGAEPAPPGSPGQGGPAPTAPAARPADNRGASQPAARSAQGAAPAPRSGGAAPAPVAPGQPRPGGPAPAPGGAPAPAVPAPAPTGPPVKLGVIGTNTGPVGQAISHSRFGLQAWAADLNTRGGLNGHPVELVFGDDGGDPARALSLAKHMVEQDKVVAFAGVYAPTSGQGISPYLEEKKIPAIEVCSCTDTGSESPMFFPIGNDPTEGNVWAHLAPLIELSDKRNVGLMYCREVRPCHQINEFMTKHEKALGIKIVYRAQIALAQPDYTAEVLAARNAGADALVLVTVNSGSIRIARSAHRQGYFPELMTQFNAYTETFPKEGGKDVEGFLTVARTAPWSSSPRMAPFHAALKKYTPDAVKTDHAAVGWASGKLFEKVAARFPAGPVSSNDVLEGLYSLRGETLDGLVAPLTFERDKGHINTNQCVIPVKVQGGKFVAPKGDTFSCAPWWKPPQV